jgi:hypothetical protein
MMAVTATRDAEELQSAHCRVWMSQEGPVPTTDGQRRNLLLRHIVNHGRGPPGLGCAVTE